VVSDQVFRDLLEGVEGSRELVLAWVDLPEFAVTHAFADLEVRFVGLVARAALPRKG
jgi:hypothetical protein